ARYNGAKRNYPAAIEDIGYAIDLDGANENLWQSLLLFQLSDDRPREAMQSYRKMQTKITDPSLPVKLLFANAAQLSDSTATAVGTYQELLYSIDKSLTLADTITNKNDYRHFSIDQAGLVSELYEMAGDAYFAAEPKMMEDSYRCYENALFFNPDNLLALNNYAYFIVDTENPATDSPRFEKAKNMSRRTVESTTSNPNGTYLDTYAWILFKEGNYKEALQYQKAAIEAAEEEGNPSAELYSHYGDILFMSGEPDEAVEYWEKALGMESDNELLQRKVKNKTFYWK
ncbi:MAG: tetratricopeptide repeat protein, partial [Muribaculaceae bacterium]|nr:tetratricopeptide repeat protein [Muribaculaceae bacterium]